MAALFALFARSLRLDLRSQSLLWTRAALVGGVLLVFCFANLGDDPAPGLAFFRFLVAMNFFIICIGALSYFATSITEEKEEGTLSLLRMTNLGPFAILFGKSTSRLCGGLLLLVVQIPFALLAVSMGGIAAEQVLKSYAVLGALLFFACNAGLLASVLARHTGTAGLITAVLGVAAWYSFPDADLPDLLGDILNVTGGGTAISDACALALVYGLTAFLIARLCFDRCTRDPVARARRGRRGLGGLASALRGKPGRAWRDPLAWRDFYFLHGGKKTLALKGAGYLLLGLYFYEVRFFDYWDGYSSKELTLSLLGWVTLGIVGESLFSASRIFRLERRDRTLSALILLPAGLPVIVRSKRRAVIFSMLPLLFFFGLLLVPTIAMFDGSVNGEVVFWGLQALALLIVEFYFHCYFIGWFSLRMRWGALPVALLLSAAGNFLAGLLTVVMFQQASLFIFTFFLAVVCVLLRQALYERLAKVAEED